jgi:tetratricopeptide (TPR) repeat protein
VAAVTEAQAATAATIALPQIGPPRRWHGLHRGVLLFLLTAVVGLWAAPTRSPEVIWKFALLLGAGLIFFLLASVKGRRGAARSRNAVLIAGGVLTLLYLLLRLSGRAPDWLEEANASVALITVPLALGEAMALSGRWQKLLYLAFVLLVVVAAARQISVLLALVGALLVICGALYLGGRWRRWLPLAVGVAALLAGVWIVVTPNSLWQVPFWESRWRVWHHTFLLLGDVPFTGAGLGSFDGWYSTYWLNIPFRYLGDSHQMYLELGLEQGVLGLLAVSGVWLGALLWLALAPRRDDDVGDLFLQYGLLACLFAGLLENTLYGSVDTLALFVLPALVAQRRPPPFPLTRSRSRLNASAWLVAAALLLGLTLAVPSLQARWQADLGALALARQDLSDFPINRWREEAVPSTERPGAAAFRAALAYDPANFTALYRLGLTELAARNFPAAADYLGRAWAISGDDHRGVVKALGYSLLWQGESERALGYLDGLSELKGELDAYRTFWERQGRADLSNQAQKLLERLRLLDEQERDLLTQRVWHEGCP